MTVGVASLTVDKDQTLYLCISAASQITKQHLSTSAPWMSLNLEFNSNFKLYLFLMSIIKSRIRVKRFCLIFLCIWILIVYVTEIDSICIYDTLWLWDFLVSLETTCRATISLFTLTAHKKRQTCTFKIVSGERAKWHERLPMRKTLVAWKVTIKVESSAKPQNRTWVSWREHCIEILYIFIQPLLNPLIGLWRVFDVDFNKVRQQ